MFSQMLIINNALKSNVVFSPVEKTQKQSDVIRFYVQMRLVAIMMALDRTNRVLFLKV